MDLARDLKKFNALAEDFKMGNIKRRQSPLENYFELTDDAKIAYCPDTQKLMEYFGQLKYNSNEWSLFIDAASNKSGSSECLLCFFEISLMDIHLNDSIDILIDTLYTCIGLKAVLMHRAKELPSVPIAYALDTKESPENIENLLKKINYERFQWTICCDLKVVGMLFGMKKG